MRVLEPFQDSWTISELAKKWTPQGWEKLFESIEEDLLDIDETLASESYFPDKAQIFRAMMLTPLDRVRVVIVGQDPYPQPGYANGLSFSVDYGVELPGSLRNIYTELATTIPGFVVPKHGDLSAWARQGVLLLNMSLTVRPKAPGSHQMVWFGVILKIIQAIQEINPCCIYVLWGSQAAKLESHLGDRSIRLIAKHPSMRNGQGFLGCGHFKKINEILKNNPIDWSV